MIRDSWRRMWLGAISCPSRAEGAAGSAWYGGSALGINFGQMVFVEGASAYTDFFLMSTQFASSFSRPILCCLRNTCPLPWHAGPISGGESSGCGGSVASGWLHGRHGPGRPPFYPSSGRFPWLMSFAFGFLLTALWRRGRSRLPALRPRVVRLVGVCCVLRFCCPVVEVEPLELVLRSMGDLGAGARRM